MNLSHAIRLNSLQIVDKKKRKRRQNRLRKFNFLRSILRAIIFHLVPYFLKTIRSILSFAEKHKYIIPIYRELPNYNKKKLLRRRHIISSNFIETFYVRHFKFLQPLHLFEARPNFPPSHNQPSRSSFHHRLSMTEYLVATERSAQRSRSIVAAKKLESHKTPKETPDCSLREAGHRHHTRIQGAAEGSTHTTRKGGWNVYILFNDKSARNQRIFAWTFSPYTRPLPSSNRRYSYDPPVLPLRDRMIEYNRPPSKRNGAG